jgi:outer membrane protein assembly factor BamB
VTGNGLIFYSTGFPKAQLQAVKYSGAGQPEIAWIYPKGVPTMSSPVPVNDFIFFTSDSGIFTCLMAKNGKQVYRDRLEGSFSASPLLAYGRLYFFSREGKTYVQAPGDKLQTLATNALDGQIAATPAAVDGAFFIRTDKALYRIEAKK